MDAKDTNELEHELAAAKSLEAYFEANVAELREETLAEHLARLLAEKHLEKADVIARSGLAELYAYHIFAGRKPHPSKPKVLALALAMQLTPNPATTRQRTSRTMSPFLKKSFNSSI